LALTAAETGHLVIGQCPLPMPRRPIDRLIDSFPPEQQNQVRTMLADSIRGILTQRLIKNKEGKKRVLATEIMVGTVPLLRSFGIAKPSRIPSLIQTGKKAGMQLMDESLMQLLRKTPDQPEAAYSNAASKKSFRALKLKMAT